MIIQIEEVNKKNHKNVNFDSTIIYSIVKKYFHVIQSRQDCLNEQFFQNRI